MRNTLSSMAAGDWRDGDILAGIKRALEATKALPPPAEFYASSIYSPDRATKFQRPSGAEAIVAHPEFWELVPKKSEAIGNPLLGIPIVDLDDDANKELCDRINRELMEIFAERFGRV